MTQHSKDSSDQLSHRVVSFISDKRVRFLLQSRSTLEPSPAASIYEQFWSLKTDSPNTGDAVFRSISKLFTWAERACIDLERLLLHGEALEAAQIRSFAHWLATTTDISENQFNRIIRDASQIIIWFMQQYGRTEYRGRERMAVIDAAVSTTEAIFRQQLRKNKKKVSAPDISDECIERINKYLKPENRHHVDPGVAVRDYLLWRLAIEFGLRIGEILALRLEDLPYGNSQTINIARIEERGSDYFDSRGKRAPRPKTLSRDLGFIFANSPIPHLLNDYVTCYRHRLVTKQMRMTKEWDLGHQFVFISHHNRNGEPLSMSTVQQLAQLISREIGANFHWHLSRHAFFNRAYAAIIGNPDYQHRRQDLVDWGGWSNDSSLDIYSNRARRQAASKALIFWQTGANTWSALD
jgi:integrase